jgi:hypothetical protein
MLTGPRMQSRYGSTEAINVNGTEICPLTTWDSKITTVLAMMGGVGPIVARGLRGEVDPLNPSSGVSAYDRFVHVVAREHELVFGAGTGFQSGDTVGYQRPGVAVPRNALSDWAHPCGAN